VTSGAASATPTACSSIASLRAGSGAAAARPWSGRPRPRSRCAAGAARRAASFGLHL
jgi:hypothetical protein